MARVVARVSLIKISSIRKFHNEFVLENKWRYLYEL